MKRHQQLQWSAKQNSGLQITCRVNRLKVRIKYCWRGDCCAALASSEILGIIVLPDVNNCLGEAANSVLRFFDYRISSNSGALVGFLLRILLEDLR